MSISVGAGKVTNDICVDYARTVARSTAFTAWHERTLMFISCQFRIDVQDVKMVYYALKHTKEQRLCF